MHDVSAVFLLRSVTELLLYRRLSQLADTPSIGLDKLSITLHGLPLRRGRVT